MTQLEIISHIPHDTSDKPALLFVHGMWHGAWCWEEHFLPYFAHEGYPAYALSLRAHGRSPGPSKLRWTSLSDYVDDLASVVDQMDALPILIGHSMGGMIIQKYLEQHHAPAAVLMASAPPSGMFPATVRVARRHPLAFVRANLALDLYHVIRDPAHYRELFFSKIDDVSFRRYHAHLSGESYRAFVDTVMLDLPRTRRIQTPMLVLGGSADRLISTREIRSTARAYDAPCHIIPDTAHDMMLEPTWRQTADIILDWLGTNMPASASQPQFTPSSKTPS